MTDIALDEKALEAATEIHRRASPRYGAEEASRMIAARVIRAYLRVSPSQVAPANPAQGVDALSDRVWRALVLDDPTNITITKDELGAALTAAIGVGGQAVADSLWVPAKPEHKKIGWTYDFDQTERLSRAAEKATGYEGTMEVIEFVMAEADRRHKSALSQPHPADERVVEALPEGTLAVHGKDVVIAYDDFKDARRAFNILENVIAAAPSEQGGDRG